MMFFLFRLDAVKGLCGAVFFFAFIIAAVSFFCRILDVETMAGMEKGTFRKTFIVMAVLIVIFGSLHILIPNQEEIQDYLGYKEYLEWKKTTNGPALVMPEEEP